MDRDRRSHRETGGSVRSDLSDGGEGHKLRKGQASQAGNCQFPEMSALDIHFLLSFHCTFKKNCRDYFHLIGQGVKRKVL